MRKLLLHVGIPKCGSTAIQRLLDVNSLKMRDAGVFVPASLGSPNHTRSLLVGCSLNRNDLFVRMHRFPRHLMSGDRKRFVDRVIHALREEVRLGPSSGLWVISCEYLSCCLRLQEVQSLGKVLDGIFERVEILVYVRSPVEVAQSMWSTNVRQGLCELSFPAPPRFKYLCDYRRVLGNWSSVFGEHSLSVARYDRNGLISSFLRLLNLSSEVIADLEMPGFQNERLSHFALITIAYLNQICKEKSFRNIRMRARAASEVAGLFASMPPYKVNELERCEYEKFFGSSDEWLRSKFFPGSQALWANSDCSDVLGSSNNCLLGESELPYLIADHMFKRIAKG